MSGEHGFYTPDERRALERMGADRSPRPELEDRIVGVLKRRGLIEAPEEVRGGSRFGALLLAFAKPALVAAAVAGAFLLGRAIDSERRAAPGTLVGVPAREVPAGAERVTEAGFDGIPQRLVVLGDEDRQYEYYVDEKGQNYYVLVKLPIPTPISPEAASEPTATASTASQAQSVPGLSNSRFEYYFDTHGNAYGVIARDHTAVDLFATR